MIVKNKHKFSKKIIIVSIATILLFVSVSTYAYNFKDGLFGWGAHQDPEKNNIVNYNPATEEQKQTGSQIKSSSNNTSTETTSTPGGDKKNVETTITAANQNGTTLQIRVLIGAVNNAGTCTLTLTATGHPDITKTTDVQPLANTSTCKGFDILTSELTPGIWRATLLFESPTLIGSTSKDVKIN